MAVVGLKGYRRTGVEAVRPRKNSRKEGRVARTEGAVMGSEK